MNDRPKYLEQVLVLTGAAGLATVVEDLDVGTRRLAQLLNDFAVLADDPARLAAVDEQADLHLLRGLGELLVQLLKDAEERLLSRAVLFPWPARWTTAVRCMYVPSLSRIGTSHFPCRDRHDPLCVPTKLIVDSHSRPCVRSYLLHNLPSLRTRNCYRRKMISTGWKKDLAPCQ